MADLFGMAQNGRATAGGRFNAVAAVDVAANSIYIPNLSSPLFGVAEYPVDAGNVGAFATSGVFVFDKPVDWDDAEGRRVYYRPTAQNAGSIVNVDKKGDVLIGFQVFANVPDDKLGVVLTQGENSVVIYVTSTADSGAGSLRQAIADAQDGDVILFDADVFPVGQTTAILLSSYITINKSVSIYGGEADGAGGYTSGASKRYYVYREIEGVKTKVYIDDDNPAQDGETVLFENVCRVALDGQEATRGASLGSSANIILSGVEFKNNGTVSSGGSCVYQLVDCNFKDSTALNGGGVFLTASSIATIDYCSFYNCTSSGFGGGIYNRNDGNRCYLNNSCFDSCSANSGGAYESYNASQGTFNKCVFYNCSATQSGGGLFSANTSQNTLTDCTISGCSASSGGGLYSTNTSQNTLTDCTISGCSANKGGGLYSYSTSQNTLTDCTISGCSASSGGGLYSTNTSQNTLTDCTISGNTSGTVGREGVVLSDSSILNSNNSVVDHLYVGLSAILNITNNITTVGSALFGSNEQGVAATVTINDGTALTLTGASNVIGATFTSEGRGYLATAAGVDISAATLTNVVACSYGAGLETFAIDADGATWTADDYTIPILIETKSDGEWTTLDAAATGGSYSATFEIGTIARAFDGVKFIESEISAYFQVRSSVAPNNGGGGAGDASPGWDVENLTITPNLAE